MTEETMIKDSISNVPKAVAAGLVDMASGMLLTIKTVESHPQEVIDILAPATKELFEGELVTTIENLWKKARGVDSDEHYFQEILISSMNLWHYFGRVRSKPETVLTVVCRGDVNMGMMIMKCRELVNTPL